MNRLDGREHFLVFEAMSNAIFVAILRWLPEELDTAMLALLGEVVMCATYERSSCLEEVRQRLHTTLDDFLDLACARKG
jgi:hypothetical protein